MDDSLRRLLLRCRSALHSCLHESELDLDRPERNATLARRLADIDAVLGSGGAVPDAEPDRAVASLHP